MSNMVLLSWNCPQRVAGSSQLKHIPIDIYDEIFSWLRPTQHPDMGPEQHHRTLARLAPVCKYFAYYTIRELSFSLDFHGLEESEHPRTPTGKWCSGIINKQEPLETLRHDVRECTIQAWLSSFVQDHAIASMFRLFLKRFPRALSRLDNLHVLKLHTIPISDTLYQTIGRLSKLRDLEIDSCYFEGSSTSDAETSTRDEKPFPVLRRLVLVACKYAASDIDGYVLKLARAPALRSLVLANSWWFPLMCPHLSQDLHSLSVNISRDNLDDLVTFLKASTALENLTIYSQTSDVSLSNEGFYLVDVQHQLVPADIFRFKLGQSDLNSLHSFSGPVWLASIFVPSRSISRLALGCHLPQILSAATPSMKHGMYLFPLSHKIGSRCSDYDHHGDVCTVLGDLGRAGGDGIKDLFIHIPIEMDSSAIASHMPNIARLQLQLSPAKGHIAWPFENQISFLASLGVGLKKSTLLDTLIICEPSGASLIHQLSPGHQYELVKEWKGNCAALTTVVFGPYMVWHWRRSTPRFLLHSNDSRQKPRAVPPSNSVHNQWELELLSPRLLRQALRKQAQEEFPEPVWDWREKIRGVFEGEPLGMGEDVERIFLS